MVDRSLGGLGYYFVVTFIHEGPLLLAIRLFWSLWFSVVLPVVLFILLLFLDFWVDQTSYDTPTLLAEVGGEHLVTVLLIVQLAVVRHEVGVASQSTISTRLV